MNDMRGHYPVFVSYLENLYCCVRACIVHVQQYYSSHMFL